ncbi:MAG: DivIVA domain-containing protein [Synergistaceae bacterium]|nr:DivIVA domain-containing protein [Synergistaceae bacterium]
MSELLTAKDIEIKAFRKVKFGGYSVPEVEDFLNQVADDIEAYTMQLDEKEARIQELEAFVKKQEAMTDAIKDALIQARKAAKDMEEQAKINTEKIIADAQAEAAKYVEEAEGKVNERLAEADRKAAEAISRAEARASELIHSKANIEQELESSREQARQEADEIIAKAKSEAKKMMTDAEREMENYENQLRFLSLQKQQFVKNTVSLLLDFGKIMDRAQQEIDDENDAMPYEHREPSENNSES